MARGEKLHRDPVEAWASIIEDADKAKSFKQARGRGGFVRSSWQEVNELIAASNVYTVKTYGPDRVAASHPFRRCRWFLRFRCTLSFADWRYLPELLRLVLRPAASLPANTGRADRRAGIR